MRLNISNSLFSTYNILADISAIHSCVALTNDDLGNDDRENNIVAVHKYVVEKTGEIKNESVLFALPGDAFRDK